MTSPLPWKATRARPLPQRFAPSGSGWSGEVCRRENYNHLAKASGGVAHLAGYDEVGLAQRLREGFSLPSENVNSHGQTVAGGNSSDHCFGASVFHRIPSMGRVAVLAARGVRGGHGADRYKGPIMRLPAPQASRWYSQLGQSAGGPKLAPAPAVRAYSRRKSGYWREKKSACSYGCAPTTCGPSTQHFKWETALTLMFLRAVLWGGHSCPQPSFRRLSLRIAGCGQDRPPKIYCGRIQISPRISTEDVRVSLPTVSLIIKVPTSSRGPG